MKDAISQAKEQVTLLTRRDNLENAGDGKVRFPSLGVVRETKTRIRQLNEFIRTAEILLKEEKRLPFSHLMWPEG